MMSRVLLLLVSLCSLLTLVRGMEAANHHVVGAAVNGGRGQAAPDSVVGLPPSLAEAGKTHAPIECSFPTPLWCPYKKGAYSALLPEPAAGHRRTYEGCLSSGKDMLQINLPVFHPSELVDYEKHPQREANPICAPNGKHHQCSFTAASTAKQNRGWFTGIVVEARLSAAPHPQSSGTAPTDTGASEPTRFCCIPPVFDLRFGHYRNYEMTCSPHLQDGPMPALSEEEERRRWRETPESVVNAALQLKEQMWEAHMEGSASVTLRDINALEKLRPPRTAGVTKDTENDTPLLDNPLICDHFFQLYYHVLVWTDAEEVNRFFKVRARFYERIMELPALRARYSATDRIPGLPRSLIEASKESKVFTRFPNPMWCLNAADYGALLPAPAGPGDVQSFGCLSSGKDMLALILHNLDAKDTIFKSKIQNQPEMCDSSRSWQQGGSFAVLSQDQQNRGWFTGIVIEAATHAGPSTGSVGPKHAKGGFRGPLTRLCCVPPLFDLASGRYNSFTLACSPHVHEGPMEDAVFSKTKHLWHGDSKFNQLPDDVKRVIGSRVHRVVSESLDSPESVVRDAFDLKHQLWKSTIERARYNAHNSRNFEVGISYLDWGGVMPPLQPQRAESQDFTDPLRCDLFFQLYYFIVVRMDRKWEIYDFFTLRNKFYQHIMAFPALRERYALNRPTSTATATTTTNHVM